MKLAPRADPLPRRPGAATTHTTPEIRSMFKKIGQTRQSITYSFNQLQSDRSKLARQSQHLRRLQASITRRIKKQEAEAAVKGAAERAAANEGEKRKTYNFDVLEPYTVSYADEPDADSREPALRQLTPFLCRMCYGVAHTSMVKLTLPSGWRRHHIEEMDGPDDGRAYFYEERSGSFSWKAPPGSFFSARTVASSASSSSSPGNGRRVSVMTGGSPVAGRWVTIPTDEKTNEVPPPCACPRRDHLRSPSPSPPGSPTR